MGENLLLMTLVFELCKNEAVPVIFYANGMIKQVTVQKLIGMVKYEDLQIDKYNFEDDGYLTNCIIYVNNDFDYKC